MRGLESEVRVVVSTHLVALYEPRVLCSQRWRAGSPVTGLAAYLPHPTLPPSLLAPLRPNPIQQSPPLPLYPSPSSALVSRTPCPLSLSLSL